jgi:hypothetical protein
VNQSSSDHGGLSRKDSGVQFHVACVHVWDAERQVLRYEPTRRPTGRRSNSHRPLIRLV